MFIKKLQLKNGYKRFRDLTIDLGDQPKRIVALVGPNGCGKSSVLDGMLFHNNAYAQIGSIGGRDHKYHSLNDEPNYSYSNIIIEFDQGDFQKVRQSKEKSGREQTLFSFRSPYRYNSNLNVRQSQAVSELRLNSYGASVASDLDAKMEENYRRLYVKFNKFLNDTDCKPSEAKAKIIGDLNQSLQKCLLLELDSIGNIEAAQGTLFFKKPDQVKPFEFNVLSSGEKEIVDLLLDIYLRQDDYNDTIFLIDEPELHINTSIQKNLLVEINRLIGPKCQLWITTHSIGFLRALQEELKDQCQIIRFSPNMDVGTHPCTLTPMAATRANWRDIFSIALDDLAALVSPKRIIYCEGRDTPKQGGIERGMDAQCYNHIFGTKYLDTLFISSGGNTELDQRSSIAIAVLGKALPSLEILVLKDRDMSSGTIATEHDRLIYLQNNDPNHRVLKRFELENYLFDEEVLREYCSSANLTFDETSYRSIVSDIVNQDVKALAMKIKSCCGIVSSINADRFKITLSQHLLEGMSVFKELESCVFFKQ